MSDRCHCLDCCLWLRLLRSSPDCYRCRQYCLCFRVQSRAHFLLRFPDPDWCRLPHHYLDHLRQRSTSIADPRNCEMEDPSRARDRYRCPQRAKPAVEGERKSWESARESRKEQAGGLGKEAIEND